MPEVECISLNGQIKRVPAERLILGPAMDGIILHEDKLLLLQMRATRKYHLPGSGLQAGECMEDALKREIRDDA